MKKAMILFTLLNFISFFGNTQPTEILNYVSTFNDGLAAIKKDNQWAFINLKGDIVVEYRSDLVITVSKDGTYPIFKDGRCLITKEKDGILYFGYIDTTGKVVVEPQFLNASNFENNVALAINLVKEELGKNKVLGKRVVNYKYFEVVINPNGSIRKYLTPKGVVVVLDKSHRLETPKITSRLLSENLCAVRVENNLWEIKKINE